MYDWNQNGKYDSSGANSDWWKWFLFAIGEGVYPLIRIVIEIITLLER